MSQSAPRARPSLLGSSLALLTVLVMVLVPASPASAHEIGGVGATNFRTTLSALDPAVPGLHLRVIENGSRLELVNETAAEVVISGYGGEPYARVGPDGVSLNDNSPATFLNVDRFSTSVVPGTADGRGPPVWRHVADESAWRWHDHRIHWMLTTLPPAVAADPSVPHRISAWTVELEYGGARLIATGTLEWVPGPSPWPWFLLAAAVAVAVVAVAFAARPPRILAGALGGLLAINVLHGLGAMLATAGTVPTKLAVLLGADALLIWPLSALTLWLLWRRHTRAAWLAAGLGLVIGAEMLIDDAPAWWRSSAPTALPIALDRATIAIVVGLGAGLVAVLPVLLRRHAPLGGQGSAAAGSAKAAGELGGGVAAERARPQPVRPEPESVRSEKPDDPATAVAKSSTVEETSETPAGIGRRQVAGLLAAGAVGALAGGTAGAMAVRPRGTTPTDTRPLLGDVGARTIPFRGVNQAGIVNPPQPQTHVWVGGFDLLPGTSTDALRDLLRRWTEAAERLTAGEPLGAGDDAVVAGLGPAALTVTVGFGPTLFGQAGVPRDARPAALDPLPAFDGETLDPARGDGDLGLVIAADDPVVVAHASRVLTRAATAAARLRWQHQGFNTARGSVADSATRRNLMGQVDGTNNPRPTEPEFEARVFAAGDAPVWMRGGSYLVVRRIRMLLDDWDGLSTLDKERVVGRRLSDGAPLTGGHERTPADLGAVDAAGALVIPVNAHMRLAAPAANEGAAMLRRGFSFVDGDGVAGLLFLAWQADPRRGFIPVQRRLVGQDAMGAFIRHEASALFAVPGGLEPGTYLGQSLVEPL